MSDILSERAHRRALFALKGDIFGAHLRQDEGVCERHKSLVDSPRAVRPECTKTRGFWDATDTRDGGGRGWTVDGKTQTVDMTVKI